MSFRTTGKFTTESMLECPDCGSNIRVGTGGQKNLDIHCASKPCHAERERQKTCTWPKPEAKPNQSLHLFKAKAAPNPPLVSAPAPIHAPKVGTEQAANADDNLRPLEVMPRSNSTTDEAEACVIATELLSQLRMAIEQIPSEYDVIPKNCSRRSCKLSTTGTKRCHT